MMEPALLIWAKKRANRERIFEVWMSDTTAKWLEKLAGISVVRKGYVENQWVVFIDPRYKEEDFERLVKFCNMEARGIH